MFKPLIQYKIIRYIISGGTAALVSLSLLYFFTDVVGIWYLLSSTLAFVVAFFVSFLLQKLWTFKDTHTKDISRQVSLYFVTAVSGLSANALFMYALVDIVGLWYIFAQILSSGTIATVTFFIYGNIIFNHVQKGHILVATGLYSPDIGGPATYTLMLESELPKRGFTVTVVPFSSVRKLPKALRHLVYFLNVCVRSTESEIVYALDPVSVGLPALIVAKLLKKRFLLRVAGDYAWEQFQQNQELRIKNRECITVDEFQNRKFDWMTEMRRKIERFVAKRAETVIVPSRYLSGIVERWGVSQEKIKVIYSAFDGAATHENEEQLRKKLNVSGTVIFSAGRLVPWKGFSVLIEIVSELKDDIPDVKLFIAGDGPEKETLQATSRKLQASAVFLGQLSRDELVKYIKVAGMFILNTGYEGFSHQLLEAMSLGVPIITTNVGGNPELIEDQNTGFLVSYNDKKAIERSIRTILSNITMRDRIVENAKKRVGDFSKEKAIEELIKLF